MNASSLRRPARPLGTLLLCLGALGTVGCGTDHLHMRLRDAPRWQEQSGRHFYQGIHFAEGNGMQGRLTITFRGPEASFDVPAAYWTTQGPQNYPRGWIEVHYEADEALKATYRAALKQLKAAAKPGDEALKIPDELPPVERFYAEVDRKSTSAMTLASEAGFKVRLVRSLEPGP